MREWSFVVESNIKALLNSTSDLIRLSASYFVFFFVKQVATHRFSPLKTAQPQVQPQTQPHIQSSVLLSMLTHQMVSPNAQRERYEFALAKLIGEFR